MKPIDNHESRITRLEVTNENIAATLIRLEKKMDDGFGRVDKKFDDLEKRMDVKFDKMDRRIDLLTLEIKDQRKESWSHLRWILGFIVTFYGASLVMIKVAMGGGL